MSVRGLIRSPGFTLLVLLLFGIGIGAVTAIFSAVNQVILQPLPFHDPDHLVMLWESNQERGWHELQVAPANALDWRERVGAFDDVALVSDYVEHYAFSKVGGAVQVAVSQVSGNAFSVLGVRPILGRTFTLDETWASADPVVVLGYGVWRRDLGADPGVVGRVIRLDGNPYRVIGVMGPSFRYDLSAAEMWTTFRWTDERKASIWFRQAHVVRAIARLKPGVTAAQASLELSHVARRLADEYPETNRHMEAGLTPLHRFMVGERRPPLLMLLGAVSILQLIVCVNVAMLLLTRAFGREREIAVRRALGASAGRIARVVLTESALLAALGAGVGLATGIVGLAAISHLKPADLPDLVFQMDWRLAAVTLFVFVASAIVVGLEPALRCMRVDVKTGLAEGSRTATSGRRSFLRAYGLVAAEIALAVPLVTGAGLMARSLDTLRHVDSGINPDHVLTFSVRPPSGIYPDGDSRAAFTFRLIEAVRDLPGVRAVGAGRRLPFTGYAWTSDFAIEGWPLDRFGVDVAHREETPGYFSALEIPVLDGELYPERLASNEPVPVVVNRAFAERYFPGESPVGHRIAFDRVPAAGSYWYRISGVVGNERMQAVTGSRPEIIAHIAGDTPSVMRFVVKTSIDPRALVPELRTVLGRLDPGVPLTDVRTMDDVRDDALGPDRFLMILLGVFATAALVLAGVGVYSVAAQTARARTRELGIRLALGATPAEIAWTLVGRALLFVALGVAVGMAGALASGQIIRRLLFEVQPNDPATLTAVAILLAIVAVVATLIPVWRAIRLSPVAVLRAE